MGLKEFVIYEKNSPLRSLVNSRNYLAECEQINLICYKRGMLYVYSLKLRNFAGKFLLRYIYFLLYAFFNCFRSLYHEILNYNMIF